ncbi:MAG TPA: (2Fe-2S) ferredoxin domain-containing protein [Candidatus Baltobacteraceae bacterium]|nr:(2Fe-2S) ferredoxin domain-containing protein [Candidatus Baltobacteraceae bacterium]
MQDIGKKYRKVVLVCTNQKENGKECCAMKGAADLHLKLKEEMKKADLTVRVSKSGCLDRCVDGVTVAIMPDDVWLGGATEADIPEIVKRAAS